MVPVLLLVSLSLASSDIPIDYGKGLEAYEANRFQEAKARFRSFLLSHKEHPLYPDGLYYYGLLEKDGEEAKKVFSYLVAQYPENRWAPDASFKTAQYYYAKGDMERAAHCFRKLISHYAESDCADSSRVWLRRMEGKEECKMWAVQVGAFQEHSNAKRTALKLKKIEYPVVLIRRKGTQSILWLVRVGYFYERGEALAAQRRLEETGYRTYLVEKPCKN
jgi:tetratricopeptide (TPR) repeat protein